MQTRIEVKNNLDDSNDSHRILQAENTAIAQIKQYIGGRFDADTIFAGWTTEPDPDPRDAWIVAIVIDISLYHLWSKESYDKVPKVRAERYADALEWLKGVADGSILANLPRLPKPGEETGTESASGVRIWSNNPLSNNRW